MLKTVTTDRALDQSLCPLDKHTHTHIFERIKYC